MNHKIILLVLLLALFAGAKTSASTSTDFDAVGPTQTATVDGFQVEYALVGEGNPTIVFLTGLGSEMGSAWADIFSPVTNISTVLAYDRLNYGKSDSSPEGVPQTGEEIIQFLRALLQEELGLPPPYVVVGHSIGGLYSQLFARQYPDEVAGVVLIDSSHPDQQERLAELSEEDSNLFRKELSTFVGFVSSLIQSHSNKGQYSELEYWEDTVQQIKNAPEFPDIPLWVITAGYNEPSFLLSLTMDVDAFRDLWLELQQDLVTLSPQGQQIVAENSGHFVQNDKPELVIQAIQDMVTAIREAN